jgi:molybdopterin synthase sulfur carrier subunit
MAKVFLPQNLTVLFPGASRQVDVEATTVADLIDQLDQRHPGMRNRLLTVGPALREHIIIFVGSEKAELSTPVPPGAEVRVIPAISGG